ncbi:MAG: c-type cytochrome, partial [Polaromonas sp.]
MSSSKPFLSKPFPRTWPLLACLWLLGVGTGHAQTVQGQKRLEPSAKKQAALMAIGRTATPAEIKAWDIDVRPDFKGLPKGQGSVRQGEVLWEAQCASCHGSFAESSEVFTPIAGGITAEDIKTGRVDGLMPGAN